MRTGFRVFAAQSQAFFVLFDQLAPRAGDEASGAALKHARACYLDVGEEVRAATADFLARSLVAVESSDAGVARRLRRLGFVEEIPCSRPPVGAFAFLGAMLVVALLGLVCLVPPPGGTTPGPVVALVIGVTQTCALLPAVLPKVRWEFFRRRPNGDLPYLGWLSAAVAAGAVALVIDRGTTALVHRDWGAAWATGPVPLSPVAFMSAGLTLVIGMLCDLELGLGRFRRLAEGALAGAVMILCIGLLELPSSTREVAPRRWFPFVLSFALGFVAGAIAPHLYRVARRKKAGGLLSQNMASDTLV